MKACMHDERSELRDTSGDSFPPYHRCDAVGMSSVPEAIAAKHAGLEIIAISALANAAAGISPVPLSGSDVLELLHRLRIPSGPSWTSP